MDHRFLAGLLFTWVLLHVLSVVRGSCISEDVSSLNRTQGDGVLFHLGRKIGNETREIRWFLDSKNLLLLTISPGESRPNSTIPQKEYEGRLSAPNDKSLMLMNVTPEDSGCYEAHIMSVSGHIHIQKYNLTVSEPVSTESSMKPGTWSLVFILVLIVVVAISIAAYVYLQRRWNCLNRIKGITSRRNNIPPVPNPREERRVEEGYALVQMTSLPQQETQMRTVGALPATATQDNEGVMLARVCTPQESS